MAVETLLRRGLYRDSVTLMRLAAALEARPGVARASAVMATPANLDMLAEHGVPAAEAGAGANDLLVVVEGDDREVLAQALDAAAALLESEARPASAAGGDPGPPRPRSLAEATEALPGATLALISCPGEYAAAEAMKALRLGLDAMIFSDNVPLDDEIALKREAEERGRLVMGPDCGTAIVGGVPLGFANRVRRGDIGVVGASGTGLQQVACLVDRRGAGISHAIGTGGRDLSAEIGGATTLRALAMLAGDEGTRTIVLVSKPPDDAVMRRVLDAASGTGKPVVACFVGASRQRPSPATCVSRRRSKRRPVSRPALPFRTPSRPRPGRPAGTGSSACSAAAPSVTRLRRSRRRSSAESSPTRRSTPAMR